MKFHRAASPHLTPPRDVTSVMRLVLWALLPGTAVLTLFFGIGVLSNLVIATLLCVSLEALALRLRNRPAVFVLGDGSALVTAWLLGLALPPLSPWWLIATASVFAIVVAKHLYGGLGHNPFNPAMVGYAAVLVSFPAEMTAWIQASLWNLSPAAVGAGLEAVLWGESANRVDGVTAATALNVLKSEIHAGRMLSELSVDRAFGVLGGHGSEWAALAFLSGGLWLLREGVIDWRIPLSTLGAFLLVATLFWAVDTERWASPLFHLFSGATLLGAFFVATDPVSASTTPSGRLYYGAGIGILTYVIRAWSGYPDGFAFAVLMMNFAAPAIDHLTRPRIYGHRQG